MGDDRFVPSVGDNALQMQEKEKTKCYIVGPAESNSFFFLLDAVMALKRKKHNYYLKRRDSFLKNCGVALMGK